MTEYQKKPTPEAIERANKRIKHLEQEIAVQKEVEHLCDIMLNGCPPSPYQMRIVHPVTPKQLEDTEREYQRLMREKEQREQICWENRLVSEAIARENREREERRKRR